MIIGIIGFGFVGKVTYILKNTNDYFIVYDINTDMCIPKNVSLNDMSICDLIFICVPTPMNKNGSCHLNIVQSVITDLGHIIDNKKTDIILRSTVPPGTSDKFNVFFMPEFLTEKNYKEDFINCKNWLFGYPKNITDDGLNSFKNKITTLFGNAINDKCIKYDNIHFMLNEEAEMTKYFRNVFLATKVSFCNEIEEFCTKKNINYDNVIKHVTLDDRITSSHTCVPGPDGKRGFGGICFPKDISSLYYQMKKIKMKSYIIQNVMKRNNDKDRKEKDWKLCKGRAVI